MQYEDPGRSIPIIFLLYSWGSLFEVPIKVPLRVVGVETLRTWTPKRFSQELENGGFQKLGVPFRGFRV